MDLYHSRLTQDDLNELIIKYKIPCDLHPRLPSEDFVMFELSDDAIGVYHRIFDFSGVRIPFSPFLLVLIKHYKIEPTVMLFQVFQTLCKLGDWFSFAKHHTLSLRVIPYYMTWRHPNLAINDPKPVVSSYRMADVHRLSARVVKLRDMPRGVGLIRVESCLEESDLRSGAPGYRWKWYGVMGIHDFLCLSEWTGAEELAVRNPIAKVIAKAEAFQKRKASTSGFASSHVAKHTSDDDDACYEISVVTPIRSATVIPPSGNQGGGFAAPATEGLNTQDYQGKGIITDADVAAALSVGVELLGIANCGGLISDTKGNGLDRNFVLRPTDCQDECSLLFNDVAWWLKGYQEKFSSLTRLESHVSALQRQITRLNYKLSASDALFAKSKAKGKERENKIKSLTKSLDTLHAEVAHLSADLNWATVLEAKKDEEILRLKELTVTLASTSLEFLSNTVPTSSADALELNEEWVNAIVNDPNNEMVDAAANAKSGDVFV
ncbi:hypothetical protein Tco_0869581 [Tanacetum coccineum]